MSRKLIFLGVLSLILAPGAALSLGLGEIRLNSFLNQPLDAEIDVSVAAAGELDSLEVQLASAEAFSRYGLDRPAYFEDLAFRVVRSGPGGAVLEVTSSSPIVEPFMTFLLEAKWSGGRILREYTVLLDPPVFLPTPEPEAAPAPAVEPARPAPAPAPVARPAPAPAPVAAATPVAADYGDRGSEYGPVQRNETLWGIAQKVRPDPVLTTNQIMIALYEANPEAFNGNINRLRAGAILRVPSRDQIASTSVRQANAEVRRQTETWEAQTSTPAPAADSRLELAPPTESAPPEPAAQPVTETAPAAPAATPAPAPSAAPAGELVEAVEELRTELAETRRMMELKDAEIAALQARLAELETQPAAPSEPEAPAATQPEPASTAPAQPAPPPGFGERIVGWLGSFWLWLVLAVVLIGGAIMVFMRKRGEEERSIEEELAETGTWGNLEPTGAQLGVGEAAPAKVTPRPVAREGAIQVEEAEREAPSAPSRPEPQATAEPEQQPAAEEGAEEDYKYPFEDTIAGETGINLDQSDPLAEADFHMAYGLYDQAADIIKKAIPHEPDRYDLRRKLIDICFVWGNAKEFLAQAQAIRDHGGAEAEADWPKIAIMGRQICPGEALFEGAADVPVDVDLGEEAAEATDTGASGSWVDFDVGAAEEQAEAGGELESFLPEPGDTQEQRTLEPEADQSAELDLEELGIDLDIGESGEYALQDLAEQAPEEESGEAAEQAPEKAPEPEASAEDAEDEGTMMMDTSSLTRGSEDPTQRSDGFEVSSDAPTLSETAGFEIEEEIDHTLLEPAPAVGEDEEPTVLGVDAEVEEAEEAEQTMMRKIEDIGGEEVAAAPEDEDLDLDDLTAVLESEVGKDQADEEDEGTQVTPGLTGGPGPGEEATVAALEEVEEVDEIGTKLDLARAYIDMGDPDGARSILGEVVAEGDEAQQEEARQLLESLD